MTFKELCFKLSIELKHNREESKNLKNDLLSWTNLNRSKLFSDYDFIQILDIL